MRAALVDPASGRLRAADDMLAERLAATSGADRQRKPTAAGGLRGLVEALSDAFTPERTGPCSSGSDDARRRSGLEDRSANAIGEEPVWLSARCN
jgi:hypothetical protein